MAINFEPVASFDGIAGESPLENHQLPFKFGPDGRLYVAEQIIINGSLRETLLL